MVRGEGESDVAADHKFVFRNAAGQVWNGSAFVTWVDGNFSTYGMAATAVGGNEFTATEPSGTATWKLYADWTGVWNDGVGFIASEGVISAATLTAAAVATQVRTELTTELGRLDAAVSSRATPEDIPEPGAVDTEAIADAVRDALEEDPISVGEVQVGGFTAEGQTAFGNLIPTADQIAAVILVTPANKIKTLDNGEVVPRGVTVTQS